jgi:hypothetical protein
MTDETPDLSLIDTKEINLEQERDRLRSRMDDLAETQTEWAATANDPDEPEQTRRKARQRIEQLTTQGNELNNQANILQLIEDEWGIESVTLKGLSAGDVNRVEDIVENHPAVRERDAWVALGTADAPYLCHDPDAVAQDNYEDTVAAVADLPLAYVRWAEGKISELSHLSQAEGNGYIELVQEKSKTATSKPSGKATSGESP